MRDTMTLQQPKAGLTSTNSPESWDLATIADSLSVDFVRGGTWSLSFRMVATI